MKSLKDRDAGCLPSSFPVQKGLKSIEYIENIDIDTRICGGNENAYPHICGVGFNFESVGCELKTHGAGFSNNPSSSTLFSSKLNYKSQWNPRTTGSHKRGVFFLEEDERDSSAGTG
jgi:hypothetical protein